MVSEGVGLFGYGHTIKQPPATADALHEMTSDSHGVASRPASPRDGYPPRAVAPARRPRDPHVPAPSAPGRQSAAAGELRKMAGDAVSPELVLVDPVLAEAARRALPDQPWLAFVRADPASHVPSHVVETSSEALPIDDARHNVVSLAPTLQVVPPPSVTEQAPATGAEASPHLHRQVPRLRSGQRAAGGAAAGAPRVIRIRGSAIAAVAIVAAVGLLWVNRSSDTPTLAERTDATPPAATSGAASSSAQRATAPGASAASKKQTAGVPRVAPIRRRIAASGFTLSSGGQLLVGAQGRNITLLEVATRCGAVRASSAPIDRRGVFTAKATGVGGVVATLDGRFLSARRATGRMKLGGPGCAAGTVPFRATRS
jgi:hypothetical protein